MIYRRKIKYDYKPRLDWGNSKPRHPRWQWIGLGCALALIVAAIQLPSIEQLLAQLKQTPPVNTKNTNVASLALALPQPQVEQQPATLDQATVELLETPTEVAAIPKFPLEPAIKRPTPETAVAESAWQLIKIRPGDNMSLIFGRLGLNKGDLHRILELGGDTAMLKRLKPEQKVWFLLDDDKLAKLRYEQSVSRALHVARIGNDFEAELVITNPEIEVAKTVGTISSSLFIAGQKAGLSDPMIMKLTQIYGWDIDFVLDIRQGDRFSLVYEKYMMDGKTVGDGKILAAEFVNQGKVFRAIRYVADGDANYYDHDGRSMRKAFLRTPVNFTRISSGFNLRRKHPVLNKIRAHRGVDYAAPHGTPVKATADGKVSAAGNNGGYGKLIVLEHGGIYSTAYAHLSRYARGIRRGTSIKQGQVIGYVGKTGLATGPHLHYEFRVNGVHRNPLTVEIPHAEPLPKKYLVDFKSKARPLITVLNELAADTTVAFNAGSSDLSERTEKL